MLCYIRLKGTRLGLIGSMICFQGLAMQRLLLAMAERNGMEACDFDFVMVAGHFLARDENIFTFFEGVQVKPAENQGELILQCGDTWTMLSWGLLPLMLYQLVWRSCERDRRPYLLAKCATCYALACDAGRHLHHHQMHHRQGQATLSVLPETVEGAEIATASQLSGTSPGRPPTQTTQSNRRPARHSSAHTGPLLLHSHHRAYLREQAAQLDDRMQRRSIVSFAASYCTSPSSSVTLYSTTDLWSD